MNKKILCLLSGIILLTLWSCDNTNKNPFEKIEKECLSNSDCKEGQECSEEGKCVDLQNDEILPQNDDDSNIPDQVSSDEETDDDTEENDAD